MALRIWGLVSAPVRPSAFTARDSDNSRRYEPSAYHARGRQDWRHLGYHLTLGQDCGVADNDDITILRVTTARSPERSFGIRQSDRLFHMYVVGQTGTGKSTLLINLARQDEEHRRGFCLIDPHGDLAERVARFAGANAIYWDVADPACPFGHNPLSYLVPQYRPLVASGLLDALKKQWSDAWGPRMEHLLRMALLALLECPGSTLADIMPLFLDGDFRKDVISRIKDEHVKSFWTREYKALRYQNSAEAIAPIANKLGGLLAHPVVRSALCTPKEPLRFRTLMDEGRSLIVNLAKGRLGADTANVVGGVIVSTMAHAAYSRESTPEELRRPYTLYVDEFHSFTTEALADMLSELRKYRLALVLTTQHGSQLEEPVRDSIFGNVGTVISFRVGAGDAAMLVKQFGDDTLRAKDLVNQGNYEAFVRLMIDGRQSKPFSARTMRPT